MENVRAELLRYVLRSPSNKVDESNKSRLFRYSRFGDKIWTRYMELDASLHVLCTSLSAIESKIAVPHHEKEKKARALIERSLYPLFALQERLPTEVAWIIVIAAHWTW
jgi:hypothetical protein